MLPSFLDLLSCIYAMFMVYIGVSFSRSGCTIMYLAVARRMHRGKSSLVNLYVGPFISYSRDTFHCASIVNFIIFHISLKQRLVGGFIAMSMYIHL